VTNQRVDSEVVQPRFDPNALNKAAVPSGHGAKAAGSTLKQKDTDDT
jgi:hypothetical protein